MSAPDKIVKNQTAPPVIPEERLRKEAEDAAQIFEIDYETALSAVREKAADLISQGWRPEVEK